MDDKELSPQTIVEMRDFMELCRDYNDLVFEEISALHDPRSRDNHEVLNETMLVSQQYHPVFTDLKDLSDRLRAFMESAGGDYALGVEDGMQRAAEMIENLITRHEGR